jgi:hypothetical protein
MTTALPSLRPPLRKPPALPSNQNAAPPPVRTGAIRARPASASASAPPPPPPSVVTEQPAATRKRPPQLPSVALAPPEHFCRYCDRRETGATPPAGWLCVQRFIAPGSVAVFNRPQWGRRYSQGLGFYCSTNCLLAALPRLSELCHDLQQRGVGMRSLVPGEVPSVLPPPVTKGGPK